MFQLQHEKRRRITHSRNLSRSDILRKKSKRMARPSSMEEIVLDEARLEVILSDLVDFIRSDPRFSEATDVRQRIYHVTSLLYNVDRRTNGDFFMEVDAEDDDLDVELPTAPASLHLSDVSSMSTVSSMGSSGGSGSSSTVSSSNTASLTESSAGSASAPVFHVASLSADPKTPVADSESQTTNSSSSSSSPRNSAKIDGSSSMASLPCVDGSPSVASSSLMDGPSTLAPALPVASSLTVPMSSTMAGPSSVKDSSNIAGPSPLAGAVSVRVSLSVAGSAGSSSRSTKSLSENSSSSSSTESLASRLSDNFRISTTPGDLADYAHSIFSERIPYLDHSERLTLLLGLLFWAQIPLSFMSSWGISN